MNGFSERTRALLWVAMAYATALAAASAAVALLPIDDLLYRTLAADLVATGVIFGWSVAFDNSSFYDPYWSLVPIAIVAYWMAQSEIDVPAMRSAAIGILVLCWGWRLTFNWARGWTGLGREDWRYLDFRARMPRFYWAVSLTGIHLFPSLIVFAGLAAAFPALVTSERGLNLIDWLAVVVGACGFGFEWLADRQLHAFVHAGSKPGETLRSGLWRHSRHPNYLGEMLIWWSLFLFGLAADPGWAAWAVLAPISMTGMFLFASIPMIEKRSLERRTNYQQVIDETSMLVPLPRRRASRGSGRTGISP